MDSTFLFINSAKYGGNGLYLVLLLIKIRNIIKKLAGNGVEDIQKKKYPKLNVTSNCQKIPENAVLVRILFLSYFNNQSELCELESCVNRQISECLNNFIKFKQVKEVVEQFYHRKVMEVIKETE